MTMQNSTMMTAVVLKYDHAIGVKVCLLWRNKQQRWWMDQINLTALNRESTCL
jgi:hypothetical protein